VIDAENQFAEAIGEGEYLMGFVNEKSVFIRVAHCALIRDAV
jgi:hypothetical protein